MAGSRLEAVAREEAVWLSGATMGLPCRSAILLPKARRTASSFGALLSLLFLERSSPASRGLDIRRYGLLPQKSRDLSLPGARFRAAEQLDGADPASCGESGLR